MNKNMTEIADIKTSWLKKPVNLLVIGLFVGALTILGLRVLLVQDHHTHYHANFVLYINGQRDEFKNPLDYEEIQSCSVQDENNPRHRVHMHQPENDAVHIHADGVTWGNFFNNLGITLGSSLIKTDQGLFVDGENDKKLTFILNGQEVDSVANKHINSEDTLLVSYGDPKDAKSQYDQIHHTAAEHNTKPDPASCSGSEQLSFGDRIKRALDFSR